MKRIAIGIALVLMILTLAFAGQPQKTASDPAPQPTANGAPPLSNPLKVALLKWYQADLAAQFPVGQQPYGVVFDGENVWTANYVGNTVTKLRASDGTVLGTFNVGVSPVGLVFDGANVWVSNSFDGTVSKLRASDGKNLGVFQVGKTPWWMAFDGRVAHLCALCKMGRTRSASELNGQIYLRAFIVTLEREPQPHES